MRNRYILLKIKLLLTAFRQKKITFRKLWNVFLCSAAYRLKTKSSGPAPFILSLELGNECNANCLFCRTEKGVIYDINPAKPSTGGIPKGKMPFDMACAILNQVKDDVLIAVLYTNGEPLLYKDLSSLIRCATEHRVLTLVATNGLLLNKKNIQEMLEGGLDAIKIQLSGFTQDTYRVQIRYGNVERLKENIRLLAAMKQAGGFHTVIMVDYILYAYNRHQLAEARAFCRDLGVLFNVRPGNPKGGLEDKEAPQSTEELPLKISCDWLWKGMQVNFNGDILQCCDGVVYSGAKTYATFKIGVTDVRTVWNGPAARGMRQVITQKGRGAIPLCAQCYRTGVAFKW